MQQGLTGVDINRWPNMQVQFLGLLTMLSKKHWHLNETLENKLLVQPYFKNSYIKSNKNIPASLIITSFGIHLFGGRVFRQTRRIASMGFCSEKLQKNIYTRMRSHKETYKDSHQKDTHYDMNSKLLSSKTKLHGQTL